MLTWVTSLTPFYKGSKIDTCLFVFYFFKYFILMCLPLLKSGSYAPEYVYLWFQSWAPLTILALIKILNFTASLVAQCKRACQCKRLGFDPWSTCCRATKPMCHNYWAWALDPGTRNYCAHVPQLWGPCTLQPVLSNKRSHCNEKLEHHN